MSTQAFALASQFAGIPAVRDIAQQVGEPSALTVVLIAGAALIAGRLIGIGTGDSASRQTGSRPASED